MTHNKRVKLATIAIATVILTTGIAGVAQAHMDNGERGEGGNKVEMHQMHGRGDRKQMIENRLTKAVEEGKITAEQKNELITKMKENHEAIEGIRESDKTRDEKKNAVKQIHDSMKQWLQDHNIDPTIILPKHFRK